MFSRFAIGAAPTQTGATHTRKSIQIQIDSEKNGN